jgi:hypothetical protein
VIIEAEAAEPPPLIHACVSGPDHWSPGTP